ncbi:MAG: fdrA domain protein [Clostridia bacterium]|nr:fdrA domain protein [Clostridia bacterium]NCC68615.1 fdrA domain protein [Clostridia bacterium]
MEYKMFKKAPAVINMGVKPFAEGVKEQGIKTIHVSWRPPADKKLARLIGKVL